jgi:hypothetical protein
MIGQKFNRKAGNGPKSIRIVGIDAGSWIAEPLDVFAGNFPISPSELAEDYGGPSHAPGQVDENAAWLSMDRNWLDDAHRHFAANEKAAAPALSPEQTFASEAES